MCGSDSMIVQGGVRGREQVRWTGSARYVALHSYQDQATAARNEISK